MTATKLEFTLLSIDEVLKANELPESGSLVERVYQLLREKIINLSLSPGMPLPEKEIATILNVSKTPVREALIRLSNDQLVNIVPKSGSYVAPSVSTVIWRPVLFGFSWKVAACGGWQKKV